MLAGSHPKGAELYSAQNRARRKLHKNTKMGMIADSHPKGAKLSLVEFARRRRRRRVRGNHGAARAGAESQQRTRIAEVAEHEFDARV